IRVRFRLNLGLSSSQSGTYDSSNFALNRPGWLERVFDDRPLDRFSFQRILHACFSLYERHDRATESTILPAIGFEARQISLQAALLSASLMKVVLDRLDQQLIDRTLFNFAEVFQCLAFLSSNSQRK